MSDAKDDLVLFEVNIECTCGVEIFRLTKYRGDDVYLLSVYYLQPPPKIRFQILERIKFALDVLRGRTHCISEIVLTRTDVTNMVASFEDHLAEKESE